MAKKLVGMDTVALAYDTNDRKRLIVVDRKTGDAISGAGVSSDLMIISPNGTKYRLIVNNGGALTTEVVT